MRATRANSLRCCRRPDDVSGRPRQAVVPRGPDVLSLESVRQWCLRSAIWSDAYAGWVIAGPDDRMLGNVLLWDIDREDQLTASIGYRLLASSRGRGVASAAAESVTSWAFEELGLERIELPHSVANLDSCRVAQHCHYALEGTQRGGYRDPAGRRWDAHVHARLRSDEVSR